MKGRPHPRESRDEHSLWSAPVQRPASAIAAAIHRLAGEKWPDSGLAVQSVFTIKGELYVLRGGWVWQLVVEVLATHSRGDVMKKILTALAVAGSLAVASVATSGPALAWRGGWGGGWGGWHGGWGWGGAAAGFAAGALIGSAIAAPYYAGGYYGGGYYPYPYPYYGYGAYPSAGPTCVWRRIWNGYTWVRACV
jgi:hypothetical protein